MRQVTPVVWTIAASDSGGASGIQADLATCHGLGVHACSVITAVTAQNSVAVTHITPTDISTFAAQIEALKTDLAPAAIKIGLLGSKQQIEELNRQLPNLNSYVVLDPVMRATTGSRMDTDATLSGLKKILPLIDLLTPNLEEAEALTGQSIRTPQDMIMAARALHLQGVRGVLLKGGHGEGNYSQDYLSFIDTQGQIIKCGWLVQPRLSVSNTRGTGCTLASAIAAFVALGEQPADACVLASAYVHQGLRTGYQVGQGAGPIQRGRWPDQLSDFPMVCDSLDWLDASAFADCGDLPLGLYPVVDSVAWLEKLLPLGISTCQLRIKGIYGEELDRTIAKAVAIGLRYRCRLFINDYWQLAIKHRAYGVHLGQEDIETADLVAIRTAGLRLGISTHGDFEWARAAALKPSYIALGAVFPTDTKQVTVIGLQRLRRWVALLKGHYALTAIGGINTVNLAEVLSSGIDSVAVVSAITKAPDYQQAVAMLHAKISSAIL